MYLICLDNKLNYNETQIHVCTLNVQMKPLYLFGIIINRLTVF